MGYEVDHLVLQARAADEARRKKLADDREDRRPRREDQGTRSRLKSSPFHKNPVGLLKAAGFLSLVSRNAGGGFPDEVKQILFCKRRTAQPALELVAALFAQHVELFLQLDAFGN